MAHITQAAILILTGLGLWWSGSPRPRLQVRGYALALAAEPFWLWDSWSHGQWGIFALACWLTASFARGLWVRLR